MFFVDVRLPQRELAHQMCDMRIWLDRHKVEIAGFLLKEYTACVAFSTKAQARAFAVRFTGRMIVGAPARVIGRTMRRRDPGAPATVRPDRALAA